MVETENCHFDFLPQGFLLRRKIILYNLEMHIQWICFYRPSPENFVGEREIQLLIRC